MSISSDISGRPDGFEYISSCGKGGYGEVWLVRENLGPVRCLKLIPKSKALVFDTEVKGLQAYYEKLSDTSPEEEHSIVTILHNGENSSYLFYTMPAADNLLKNDSRYIPDSLQRRLADHRFSREEIIQTANALVSALNAFAKRNIVHRDIKPANIFFFNGEPRLGDIGLMTDITGDELLEAKAASEFFIPPEAHPAFGAMPVPATEWDLYAFGIVLYMMDTGNGAEFFDEINHDAPSTNPDIEKLWRSLTANERKNRLTDLKTITEYVRKLSEPASKQAPKKSREISKRLRIAHTAIAILLGIIIGLCSIFFTKSPEAESSENIFEAIDNNNAKAVSEFIKNGQISFTLPAKGMLPLEYALSQKNIAPEIIELLVNNGATAFQPSTLSYPELALSHRQPADIFELILLNTIRPGEIKDSNGGNLIHTAVRMHSNDAVNLLLETGLKPDTLDKNMLSPLMKAIFTRQPKLAQSLLLNNASMSFKSPDGITALHCIPNDFPIGELPVVNLDFNAQLQDGSTPLLMAVRRNGSLDIIEFMLQNKANPNLCDKFGNSPLSEAVLLNNISLLRCLADKWHADINTQRQDGKTLMHLAAIYNRQEICRYLAAKGLDISAKDKYGRTPLHYAYMQDNAEMIKCLEDMGADNSAVDNLGISALDMASLTERKSGQSAMHINPAFAEIKDVLELFYHRKNLLDKDKCKELNDILTDCCNNGMTKDKQRRIHILLNGEPSLDQACFKMSPAHFGILCGDNNILMKILACTPDIDCHSADMLPPIFLAVKENNITALEYLCTMGADFFMENTPDSYGISGSMSLDSFSMLNMNWDALYFSAIGMPSTFLEKPRTPKLLPDTDEFRAVNDKYLKDIYTKHIDKFNDYEVAYNIFTIDDFLHLKMVRQNTSALKYVLDGHTPYQASPNLEYKPGNYSLADNSMSFSTLQLLLSKGANPNMANSDGSLPLVKAILEQRQFYYIRTLLDYGADPSATDSHGMSAYDAALQNNAMVIARLLNFYSSIK